MSRIRLPDDWKARIGGYLQRDDMQALAGFLRDCNARNVPVYPPYRQLFAAFEATAFADVKVVILGQDPYHGPGQAHGLSFSVPPGIAIPPSLLNIYKELQNDLGIRPASHGNLQQWAAQGVLLLNSVLSVQANRPGSHQGKGWEGFTDHVIDVLNNERDNVVFMLWGSYAQGKGKRIDRDRHCVLKAPHPSPLSAYRGFFGCAHFSKANRYLAYHGKTPIVWQLPDA